MVWAVYGGFVVVAATGAYFALKYAKKHRLGVYENAEPKKVGRHALTAEIKVVDNETAKGYADYKTADIPRIPETVVVGPETPKAPVLAETTTIIHPSFLPPVPMAVRTDTAMMEAVNPADYPDWLQEAKP